jgi:hypothetical protein
MVSKLRFLTQSAQVPETTRPPKHCINKELKKSYVRINGQALYTGSLASGEITPEAKPLPGVAGRKRKLKEHQETLKNLVAAAPDATLEGLADQLPIKVSTSMVYRELQHLKITYKKTLYAAEQNRPDVAQQRAEWKVKQLGLKPKKLVATSNKPFYFLLLDFMMRFLCLHPLHFLP